MFDERSFKLTTLVVESFGRLGEEGYEFIDELATHLRIYASTHLRIYVSTFPPQSYTRHTHTPPLPFPMPATRQYSRAQQNRRNEQQRLRRARRNETLNCRRNSRNGSSRGGHVRHDNARPKSTYVRSPNMSTSISQFWGWSATKNREHLLRWMHGTTSSTPHNGLPTSSSLILLPHANTALSESFIRLPILHTFQ